MKRRIIILTLALAGLAQLPAWAAPKNPNVLDIKESITDDAIIYPESFETDAKKLLESWYMRNYTDTDDRYRMSGNPSTSDAVIRQRLAELPTVIDMPFNQIVRSYIDRYMERGRPLVASLLGLSTYYMPIFEEALEAEQLPLELKYLPVIESALDPNAVSRSGAGGLWQFMPASAKGYGLEISSLVDERRDPYKSSKMAAKMLHDLYDTYGDWSLAIAAYNCGPGAVNKAIRRAGGDPKKHDFWSIYEYLSPETRGYVPMFIAANYVMTYYPEHNISPVLPTRPLITDSVGVATRVHFDQISKVLDIPKEEIRILNPQFRADIIPGSGTRQYMLILPAQQVQAYIMSEDDILAYESAKYARRIDAEPGEVPEGGDMAEDSEDNELLASRSFDADDEEAVESDDMPAGGPMQSTNLSAKTRMITHTVKSGETINDIAGRYGVRVSDIRNWNSLRRNAVRVGQKLRIETTMDVADTQTVQRQSSQNTASSQPVKKTQSTASAPKKNQQSTTAKKTQPAKPAEHSIKNGETLSSISKKYGVTIDELKRANNMTGDAIRAGKTLKIPAKSSKSSSASSSSKKKSGASAKKSTSSSKKRSSSSKKKRR